VTPPDEHSSPAASAVPPVGEEIHLPDPSMLPVVNAVGITLAVLGVVLSWLLTAAGVLIFVLSTVRWIRDTRREISELPLQH
jgi:hypothetical protein